ncbi:DUF4143 domain-containing protein [Acidithiobacillus ferrooxidans]|uniref:DUF4143 domain-containing protein n=1 Tax=Acidithiobacillus ferrooxidans TaxID=920 RepID=UPI00214B69B9|nr:DUF4143 domain-containing protein [Acidithiobacillus ferrooxidans]MCR2829963.1 DUF4143 domain-containing protein [Acidithiobacillus ferrooxidans]
MRVSKEDIILADAAIAPAVMLKGKSVLDDPAALGVATETAVFKHLFARYYTQDVRFTYWHGKQEHEVDLVAEIGQQLIPFEVKYRIDILLALKDEDSFLPAAAHLQPL